MNSSIGLPLVSGVWLATVLLWGSGVSLGEDHPLSGSDVSRKAADTRETSTPSSAQERAAVERKVQAELDELQAGIEHLRDRMDHLSTDARARAEASIADLERRKDEARKKLEEITVAGEATWERLRAGLESALDELQRLYKRVVP